MIQTGSQHLKHNKPSNEISNYILRKQITKKIFIDKIFYQTGLANSFETESRRKITAPTLFTGGLLVKYRLSITLINGPGTTLARGGVDKSMVGINGIYYVVYNEILCICVLPMLGLESGQVFTVVFH